MKTTKIALFEGQKIRRAWEDKEEKWFFSVVDVVAALTDSVNPRDYWFKMKIRVKTEEVAELSTFCRQLKLQASDGKYYLTDVSNTEGILRIIQSIPSPKAEPFKLWLARVGYERIEETEDPEKAIQRALATYLKKGYSKNWVDLRLKSIEIRKELKKENLRDGMVLIIGIIRELYYPTLSFRPKPRLIRRGEVEKSLIFLISTIRDLSTTLLSAASLEMTEMRSKIIYCV